MTNFSMARSGAGLRIGLLSGPAGSGKTHGAIQYGAQLARNGEKLVIAQPSTLLINQTLADFQRMAPDVTVTAIHHETVGTGNVVASVVKHFKESAHGTGEILLITHNALERTPFVQGRAMWRLLHDETPLVIDHLVHQFDDQRHLLLDCVVPGEADATYTRLLLSNHPVLDEIMRGRTKDQARLLVADLVRRLMSGNWQYFCDSEQLGRFQRGEQTQIDLFGLRQPSALHGWRNVTIMGANLADSLVVRFWQQCGVEFTACRDITLRNSVHQNGALLEIYYGTERNWSKKLRDAPVETGAEQMQVVENIIARTQHVFADQPYVFMANRDQDDDLFPGGTRLPNSSHGINQFMGFDRAVVLSALNPQPQHVKFIREMAQVDGEELRVALSREATYQAVLRTSLRNPASQTPKQVVVPDAGTAHWLAGLFSGARVAMLPGEDPLPPEGKAGRPRKHKAPANKQADYRRRTQERLVSGLRQVNNEPMGGICYETYLNKERKVSSQMAGGFHFGTLHASKTSREHSAVEADSWDPLSAYLRQEALSHACAKSEIPLISPARFVPVPGADTTRGLANVESLCAIYLDNDGGGISHQDFAAMFPRVRMLIHASHSSTNDHPRYRVIIPCACLLTKEAHTYLIQQIIQRLRSRKFFGRKWCDKHPEAQPHGFDESKFVASSLFHLPRTPAAGPEHTFFIDHNEAGREPLNPYTWIDRSLPEDQAQTTPAKPVGTSYRPSITALMDITASTKNPALRALRQRLLAERIGEDGTQRLRKIDEARTNFRQAPKGSGHSAFFRMAAQIKAAGVPMMDLETMLHEEARMAHSPQERRAEIPSIMTRMRHD